MRATTATSMSDIEADEKSLENELRCIESEKASVEEDLDYLKRQKEARVPDIDNQEEALENELSFIQMEKAALERDLTQVRSRKEKQQKERERTENMQQMWAEYLLKFRDTNEVEQKEQIAYLLTRKDVRIEAGFDSEELAVEAHTGMSNYGNYEIQKIVLNKYTPKQIHKSYFDPF